MKTTIIVFLLIISSICKCQHLSVGIGGIGSSANRYLDSLNLNLGFEGIVEYQLTDNGFAVSLNPYLLFKNDKSHFTLPVEVKWIFGKKNRVYPFAGIELSTRPVIGGSFGAGYEREIFERIRLGLKTSVISELYYIDRKPRNEIDYLDPPLSRFQIHLYLNRYIN